MKNALIVGACLGIVALSAALAQQAAQSQPAKTNPAAVEWVGAHSNIKQRAFERVRTTEAWEDLWHHHTGEGRRFKDQKYAYPPRIDFSRFEVIAFFRGPSTNRDGEQVESIDQVDGNVRLRFDSISYQTMAPVGQVDHGDSCEPFGIWLIDRTDQPIIIEENVQNIIGQPPKWKEQHRFEAPATAK